MFRSLSKTLLGATLFGVASSTAYAGKDENSVTWATGVEVYSADFYYQNIREVGILTLQVCDTLLHRDPFTNEIKPLLAESYEWMDNTTLDVTLRDGIKFHNGSDFDAKDVAYTLNHVKNPDNGAVTQVYVNWIDNVEVVNEDKVRIHAKEPTPAALNFLSGVTPIYPDGHYDDAPEIAGADNTTRHDWGAVLPVCTGPYKIEKFEPGASVTLVKNEEYFPAGPKGQPKIERLVYRTIPDKQTQLAELITGNIDWVWSIRDEDAEQLRSVPNVTVESTPTPRMSFLQLDAAGRTGDTPVTDVRVRRAIYHAIDREAISHELVGEGSRVLNSMCAITQFGCTEDVQVYEYDPVKAKELLEQAGYSDGFSIPMYAYRDRPYTEAVLGYLREVGIDVDLNFVQWKVITSVLHEDKSQMAHLTWGSNGIQDISASTSYYFKFSPDDYARDPDVRDWLEQGDTTVDPAKRKELYAKALQRIASEAYYIPLFMYTRTYAFNSDLDFPVTPDEYAHFYLAEWK